MNVSNMLYSRSQTEINERTEMAVILLDTTILLFLFVTYLGRFIRESGSARYGNDS